MSDMKDVALGMVVCKYAIDRATAAQKELRAIANTALDAKDRVSARSPIDGKVIGSVTKPISTVKAVVDDEAALMAWMGDNQPDALHDMHVIGGTTEDVIAVLIEHAPHLVESTVVCDKWARDDLLRRSERTGKPAAPGIRVETTDNSARALLEKGAEESILALIVGGWVSLDGTITPQIPPASHAA